MIAYRNDRVWFCKTLCFWMAGLAAVAACAGAAHGADGVGVLSLEEIAALEARGKAEGWTFEVGPNPATLRRLDELCGLKIPAGWRPPQQKATFGNTSPPLALPTSFDWRTQNGCTPVRDQGSCGSCWAFATVGALECAIRVQDGVTTDLSEQWLVSCNRDGWSCSGGWFAHDYHESATDSCGGTGAVLETSFPYAAANRPCSCPYSHGYRIRSWEYIGPDSDHDGVPDISAIKQAIMTYGPVSAAVYVDSTFTAYRSGVFSSHLSNPPNHAIVLVGWDDNQGSQGVWFLRNSWGADWGEAGYMRIAYGSSNVGYAACYVDYPGASILTDSEAVTVPEGGIATFRIKLGAQPAGSVTVSVSRAAGDSDISVWSGSSLTFTTSNWSTYQTVTLAAATDADGVNSQATIRCSASGYTDRDVTATEQDSESPAIEVDPSAVTVPEGGTATFRVRLSLQPTDTAVVSVSRVSGDTDISVSSGSTLTFTTSNWGTYQMVTLAAAADSDATNGEAMIGCSASGLLNKDVTATEQDAGLPEIVTDCDVVTVPELGTATFRVKLGAQPSGTVSLSAGRTAGDVDIDVISGSFLAFTSSTWDIYQTVTLTAVHDTDVTNGSTTIRCSADGYMNKDLTATEADDDTIAILTSVTAMAVPEGGSATLLVKLNGQPSGDVSVSIGRVAGDADIQVTGGASQTFTPSDWNTWKTVTLAAVHDPDASVGQATIRCSGVGLADTDVTATEQEDDTLSIQVDPASVTVPEAGTATFSVRLGAQPTSDVTVSTSRLFGDTDIAVVSGSSLVFAPANWDTYQAVTLSAAHDTDMVAGQATFRCTATGWSSTDITATEQDGDVPSLVTDTSSVTVPEGGTATFRVKLGVKPAVTVAVWVDVVAGDSGVSVASGSLPMFTTSNWDVYQTVTLAAAHDADTSNGVATVRCIAWDWASVDVTATVLDDEDAANAPEPDGGGSVPLSSPVFGCGVGLAEFVTLSLAVLFAVQRRRR